MTLPESAKEDTEVYAGEERGENGENGGSEENEEIFPESPEDEDEDDNTEKIVVLPEEEEDFDDVLRNGPPSSEFAEFFNSIPTEETNEHTLEYLCSFAWSQYTDVGRQVDMEGEAKAWMACSIFLSMIKKKVSPVASHAFTIRSLQCSSGVSIIELFDKLERFTETVSNSKKIKEQIQKVQGTLAVAAVVYKKLLPVYRGVFLEVETPSTAAAISTYDLLRIIWTVFCLLKKHLKQEDLLNSYNLLLCVIELFYEWICKLELDELVNHEFSEKFLSSDCSILEFLCRTFGGSVLDAKHFKQHIFSEKVVSVLAFEGAEFFGDPSASLKRWEGCYEDLLRKRAELDERMFLPAERDFNQVFDALYDGSAVELLRRGPDDTKFADVELLLRMSTQNCLEKLMDNKKNGPNASKSYILSSDNLFPTTPLTAKSQNATKLMALVPEGFNVAGSQLDMICSEMKDSPLPIIASHIEYFAQLFNEKVTSEAEELGKDYDADIYNNLSMLTDFVKDLAYTIIERIVKAEREKRADSESDLCNVYQKEEFLQSIAVCVLELVFFSYNSKRKFPWSIDLLNLEPICFQKAVLLVVRALPELSREMVKHLNKKEEEVLEELGWSEQSPIWLAVSMNPSCVPSCDVAWKQPKMLAEKYSPVKRMRLEDGSESPVKPVASSITMIQFVGKVYFLACGRLNDLCDRVKITEIGKRMCWTLLDHVMRNETSLMLNRHLDQNLLCVVYAVAKYIMIPCTFMDLIAHYGRHPQCESHIYREINVDSSLFGNSPSDDGNSRDSTSNPAKLRCGSTMPTSADSVPGSPGQSNCEKVDLIGYYNKVFLPRVESFIKTLETAQDKLIPMPKTSNFGSLPMKRTIGEKFQVNVTALNSTTNQIERRYKYNLNQSPRKELQAINQIVGHSTYYEHESPDQKVYTTAFRR